MKRGNKIRVSFFDENHLVEKARFRWSWWWVGAVTVLYSCLFLALGMCIILFTPLKQQLPGYMPVEQRSDTETAVLELDSLEAVYRINQAYIDNVAAILDGAMPTNVRVDTISASIPLELDSLLLPSEIELEFVRKMEDKGYIIAAYNNDQTNDSTK